MARREQQGDKGSKGQEVRRMFDAIAGRYDLMNRVMTLGQDQRWRRFVVDTAEPGEGSRCLDLATGTGDIAALMQDGIPGTRVIGADFAKAMLARARTRFSDKKIDWQVCDANRLPFKDGSLDVVTFGYLLRNVADVSQVLKEVYRVLGRGGKVVCLDTTPPDSNLFQPFIHFYLHHIIPVLGRILASDEAAYAYLTGSTMDFYRAGELAQLFETAGFTGVAYKKFMAGTIAVHWGEKA